MMIQVTRVTVVPSLTGPMSYMISKSSLLNMAGYFILRRPRPGPGRGPAGGARARGAAVDSEALSPASTEPEAGPKLLRISRYPSSKLELASEAAGIQVACYTGIKLHH
jgi:hypothetical protein